MHWIRRAVNGRNCTDRLDGPSVIGVIGILVLANAIIRVQLAVEGLGVLDSARIEFALFILLQEGATLCGEKAALAPGIAGVYG
jgi:hypothetical protein